MKKQISKYIITLLSFLFLATFISCNNESLEGNYKSPNINHKVKLQRAPKKASINCPNISPKFDFSLDNFLKVTNSDTKLDAEVKLINAENLTTITRVALVEKGTSLKLKNLPGKKYNLEVTYGNNYKVITENGNCIGTFKHNLQTEKESLSFDFRIIKTDIGVDVPSYEIDLSSND